MAVFQKILLPWVIQPGLAPTIKIKNPPQTKRIPAAGGIRPIKTKSIMFLKSLKRSHWLQGAGLTEVPHGTNGHQETAKAVWLRDTNKTRDKIPMSIFFLILDCFYYAASGH